MWAHPSCGMHGQGPPGEIGVGVESSMENRAARRRQLEPPAPWALLTRARGSGAAQATTSGPAHRARRGIPPTTIFVLLTMQSLWFSLLAWIVSCILVSVTPFGYP